MNVALVQDTEHDVHSDERRQNQIGLIGQGTLKDRRRALEAGMHAGRHPHLGLRSVDQFRGLAQGRSGGEIERNSRNRELSLVVDRHRGGGGLDMRKCAERNDLRSPAGNAGNRRASRTARGLRRSRR